MDNIYYRKNKHKILNTRLAYLSNDVIKKMIFEIKNGGLKNLKIKKHI